MTSSTALILLVGSSLLLWVVLAGFAIARKVRRDRRELRCEARRVHYRQILREGDDAALQAMHEEARAVEAQVDLAVSIDAVQRSLTAERIAQIGRAAQASKLLPTLIAELHARNPVTRARAAMLLTRPGIPSVVEQIAPLLADPDSDVRLVACAGLGRIGTPEAAEALIWALVTRTLPPERVIERLGAPWAVPTILQTLADGPSPMPAAFGAARGQGREVALDASLARALGLARDRRAEQALIGLLGAGAEEVQVSAARALGRVGGRASVPALIAALASEVWPVRAQAAKALGSLGAHEALPALERCLPDEAWWVRANSARALRELGDPGVRALRRALLHEDRYARDRAREQLAQIAVVERHEAGAAAA